MVAVAHEALVEEEHRDGARRDDGDAGGPANEWNDEEEQENPNAADHHERHHHQACRGPAARVVPAVIHHYYLASYFRQCGPPRCVYGMAVRSGPKVPTIRTKQDPALPDSDRRVHAFLVVVHGLAVHLFDDQAGELVGARLKRRLPGLRLAHLDLGEIEDG